MKKSTLLNKTILFCLLIGVFFACRQNKQNEGVSEEEDAADIEVNDAINKKNYSSWMADSELQRNPKGWTLDFVKKPKWEYTHGLIMTAMEELYKKTGNRKYFGYTKDFADFMIERGGDSIKTYNVTEYNIDRVHGGRFLIGLYQETKDEKYKKAAELLRDQMKTQPRTSEGGFWHKKIYPHQMWLDGLYMGSTFLARYAEVFDEPELYDDVVKQFSLVREHLYDNDTGLYYHGWDEKKQQSWADSDTGLSANFWGRSVGWLSMALVDVLDYLPEEHPDHDKMLDMTKQLAKAIVHFQDDSGVWYQVIDQGDREGNYLESSASSMFAYFLLKGTEKGYLSDTYRQAGIKAYEGILKEFIRDNEDGTISITNVNAVSGLSDDRDGSFEYYISEEIRDDDPKAVGPFILASIYYENLNH